MPLKTNVIWIASYPKSGNTWLHQILQRAGRAYGFPRHDVGVYRLLEQGVRPELCGAVRDDFQPCIVLKTHSPYRGDGHLHEIPDVELDRVRFVYICRNPFDVLLSYINFTKIEYARNADRAGYRKALFRGLLGLDTEPGVDEWARMTLDDIPTPQLDHALRVFSRQGLSIPTLQPMAGSWLENLRSWQQQGGDGSGVFLTYESCVESADAFLACRAFFRCTESDIAEAVGHQQRSIRQSSEQSAEASVFFNKMSSYYFRQYFSPQAIDRFLADHHGVLREVGYGALVDALAALASSPG
jgi:hypothetical protein